MITMVPSGPKSYEAIVVLNSIQAKSKNFISFAFDFRAILTILFIPVKCPFLKFSVIVFDFDTFPPQ